MILTVSWPELFMNYKKPWIALIAGIVCGALVWAMSIPITGAREPFDSPSAYYKVAMFFAGIVSSVPAPRFWLLSLIGVILGQHIYSFLFLPETRGWVLFGLTMNLALLLWVPAAIGAFAVYCIFLCKGQLTKGASGGKAANGN